MSSLKNQNDFVVIETASGGDGLDMPKVMLTLGIAVAALVAMFMGMPVELAMMTAAALLLLTGLLKPEEA